MTFAQKLRQRPKDTCECWDCLRSEGLTPPRSDRGKHKSLYYPENRDMGGPGIDTPKEEK